MPALSLGPVAVRAGGSLGRPSQTVHRGGSPVLHASWAYIFSENVVFRSSAGPGGRTQSQSSRAICTDILLFPARVLAIQAARGGRGRALLVPGHGAAPLLGRPRDPRLPVSLVQTCGGRGGPGGRKAVSSRGTRWPRRLMGYRSLARPKKSATFMILMPPYAPSCNR